MAADTSQILLKLSWYILVYLVSLKESYSFWFSTANKEWTSAIILIFFKNVQTKIGFSMFIWKKKIQLHTWWSVFSSRRFPTMLWCNKLRLLRLLMLLLHRDLLWCGKCCRMRSCRGLKGKKIRQINKVRLNFHWYFYENISVCKHQVGFKQFLDIIWPLNQHFNLKNQRNWKKQVWMINFWSGINCILLHWRKKLTLSSNGSSKT